MITYRRIPPQTGSLFKMRPGSTLRIIDPIGQQVADVFAFTAKDTGESLSSGRTLDYASRIWLTTGDLLYSNRSRPMFRIGDDTVGRHDFILAPCSQEMFDLLYPDHSGYHPSCLENLAGAFVPHGITSDQIGTTFNVFMNVAVTVDGRIDIQPPLSQANDHVDLVALEQLLVGVAACSAEICNNGTLNPIDVEYIE